MSQNNTPPDSTLLDPFHVMVDRGLTDERVLEIEPELLRKLKNQFETLTKNMPWNAQDRLFAHRISERYFEAFHLRTHATDRLRTLKSASNSSTNSEARRLFVDRIHEETHDVGSLHNLLTATISRDAFKEMTQTGIGGKIYDTDTAIKFLGSIIRFSIHSHFNIFQKEIQIAPAYMKEDGVDKFLHDIFHAPEKTSDTLKKTFAEREAELLSNKDLDPHR